MNALLSTTYFGPVQWYQHLNRAETAFIEHCENFQKQTYRNRCIIATTNGPLALTVPTEHGESLLIRDIRISDHGSWRRLHWNALMSAYSESPFFEFLADDLHPFFEKRWEFLIDFNEAIREVVCQLIDIHPQVSFTEEYQPMGNMGLLTLKPIVPSYKTVVPSTNMSVPSSVNDLREVIRPKHPGEDPLFDAKPYYQVYQQKYGFKPNLSILDLLLNMGPESIYYL